MIKRILTTIIIACMFTSSLYAQEKTKLYDFVTKQYVHGMPYEEAKAFGGNAVPKLIDMLQNKSLEYYWPNIVTTIGYIGDPSAILPLNNFVQNSIGEISTDRFRAILRVFQALGHIAQTGNAQAIKILKEYTALDSWKSKKIQFKFQQYQNDALSEVLARQAIVGLGISGRTEARQRLIELSQKADTRKDWTDNLQEALTLNEKVSREGAEKVFNK